MYTICLCLLALTQVHGAPVFTRSGGKLTISSGGSVQVGTEDQTSTVTFGVGQILKIKDIEGKLTKIGPHAVEVKGAPGTQTMTDDVFKDLIKANMVKFKNGATFREFAPAIRANARRGYANFNGYYDAYGANEYEDMDECM